MWVQIFPENQKQKMPKCYHNRNEYVYVGEVSLYGHCFPRVLLFFYFDDDYENDFVARLPWAGPVRNNGNILIFIAPIQLMFFAPVR